MPRLMWGQTPADTDTHLITITATTNEAWWAGIIEEGFKMPLADGYKIDVWGDNQQNQIQPLLLSDQGDVIWSDGPFKLQFQTGEAPQVDPQSKTIFQTKAGNSLRNAFLFASRKYLENW